MIKDVFTATEIANICRVSRQTVNRRLNNEIIKAFRPTRKANWKITRKEFVKFMKDNNIPMEFLKGDKNFSD